jgi:hypothetical protein
MASCPNSSAEKPPIVAQVISEPVPPPFPFSPFQPSFQPVKPAPKPRVRRHPAKSCMLIATFVWLAILVAHTAWVFIDILSVMTSSRADVVHYRGEFIAASILQLTLGGFFFTVPYIIAMIIFVLWYWYDKP